MKDLLKIMIVLSLAFASTFIVVKTTGVFMLDDIQRLLEQARQIHPEYLTSLLLVCCLPICSSLCQQ